MTIRLNKMPRVETVAVVTLILAIAPSFALATGNQDSGTNVYKAKCATCHGQDGSGNTPVGKSLQVADLRSAEIQKKSDAELAQSVSEGKGNMPAFKTSITDDEIHAVLGYVRTLAPKGDSAPKKKSGN